MTDCTCPGAWEMNPIFIGDCGVDFKQIQGLAFIRQGTNAVFDATASSVKELSSWQSKMTATGDDKLVVALPIGGEPTITAGDAVTNGGGGNDTFNGQEELIDTNPSVFAARFKSLSAAEIRMLKSLVCEKNLLVVFLLQGNRIAIAETVPGDASTSHIGIEVLGQVFVSDRNNEGFGTKDYNLIRFSLNPGWSDVVEVVKPNFNWLTELKAIAKSIVLPAPAPAAQT